MSKGPRIKPTVRQVIVGEALKDHKKPRRQLMVELQTIIESMGEIAPAEETLEKLISRARSHPENPQEKPWSLATLEDYPIPPEALPKVLEVFAYELLKEKEWKHLTTREAKWTARLSFVVKNPELLSLAAVEYAEAERVAIMLGVDMGDPYVDLVDGLLPYEDMKQEMGEPLSYTDKQKLRYRVSEEWYRYRKKNRKKKSTKLEGDDAVMAGLRELREKEAQNERSHNQEG